MRYTAITSRMLRLIVCLVLISRVYAQECRLTNISPSQPPLKVEDGERATESQTFQTAIFAISPSGVPHFVDSATRIRRIDPSGRIFTLAGNGFRADFLTIGPALETPLPAIGQLLFSPSGTLHFTATGRVFKVVDGAIQAVAGSGRPGFNGESGVATEVNLGTIVNVAFSSQGELLILDAFTRLRRVNADGSLQTIAGSTRLAATAGLTGDNGPATAAALSSPRQVLPLNDGSIWIKDLSGRHIRLIGRDGIIRTVNTNFDAAINLLRLADGTPAAATDNRVYPILPNGTIETGANPFRQFTGTPRAVGAEGALYFQGSARPDQQNPLLRMDARGMQTVVGGAPVPSTVDGQAPPFGISRNNVVLYSASQGGKAGILEVRAGQAPRFVVGGGGDITDPQGKTATDLSIFGITAFSVDGQGRIVIGEVNRRRILVVGTDGKTSILKNLAGEEIPYAATGALGSLQRIAADNVGDIYWFSQGAIPIGGVFTAEISVWTRADSSVRKFTVVGLAALTKLDDGSVGVIAGNATGFRSLYKVSPAGLGEPSDLRMLPLQSATRWQGRPYFIAAAQLFRGAPGLIERLDLPTLPTGANFVADYVFASSEALYVHLTNGGFYRIEDADSCRWAPQPVVHSVVNAASYGYPDRLSARELITAFGVGLGPAEGQGLVLDGALRAGSQPAPYPTLVFGNFSGLIPEAAVTGTSLPVIYSDANQVTVQAPARVSGTFRLYYVWQGLTLFYPRTIGSAVATPGLFQVAGQAIALNADGTRNSAATPAERGTIVQLYATGLGETDASLLIGEFWRLTPLTSVLTPVLLTIGGLPSALSFAGGAPGAISGIYQINATVPTSLEPGEHEIAIQVGTNTEPALERVKIFVR